MNDLIFAPMVDEDVDQVCALWKRCGLLRPFNEPLKDIEFARCGPQSDVLVAKVDDRVIASVMVGHDGHRGIVYYVSVDPGAQGKGYGKQVMAAAEDWLRARGVWKLNLLVRAENEAVRGFYESLGYEVEPRLCMARRLIDQES
ncbi:MAG: GNAT family acetyltransferase [Aestuariivirgaceae bacterium]